MIAADALVLLDTNILLHLLRNRSSGRWIATEYELATRAERPLICEVTIGELLRIGGRPGAEWGAARRRALALWRQNLVVMPIGRGPVFEAYAEVGAFADAAGRGLSDNDVWIAACARVAGAVLLTTDADFDVLHPRFPPARVDQSRVIEAPGIEMMSKNGQQLVQKLCNYRRPAGRRPQDCEYVEPGWPKDR